MIDIGINLSHDSFDNDRGPVVDNAKAAGVRHMVVTGTSLTHRNKNAQLIHEYPGYLSHTAGIHPHHSNELSDTHGWFNPEAFKQLTEWASTPSVVAVGECGLDYFRMFQEKNIQIQCFEKHIECAILINKPLFLHVREAHEDFLAVLKTCPPSVQAVVHCFTGSESELEDYLQLGCYIGITGWVCDERRGSHILEYLAKIPDDRLMIETDAPYLLPRTLHPRPKDRRNEPRFLTEIATVVAHARNQPLEFVQRMTHNNAVRFFGLDNNLIY